LEVAVDAALVDTTVDRVHRVRQVQHVDQAHHAAAAHEAQRGGVHQPAQAVATHRQCEAFGVLVAAAVQQLAVGVDQRQVFDVIDQGSHGKSTTVRVGGDRATQSHGVDTSLLLPDGPCAAAGGAHAMGGRDDVGPLRTGLDAQQAPRLVHRQHGVRACGVQQHLAGCELLAAHCVPATGHRQRKALASGLQHERAPRVQTHGPLDASHVSGIEGRVNVVDDRHGQLRRSKERRPYKGGLQPPQTRERVPTRDTDGAPPPTVTR
jgi:hypothetical protein